MEVIEGNDSTGVTKDEIRSADRDVAYTNNIIGNR